MYLDRVDARVSRVSGAYPGVLIAMAFEDINFRRYSPNHF